MEDLKILVMILLIIWSVINAALHFHVYFSDEINKRPNTNKYVGISTIFNLISWGLFLL